MSDNTRTPPCVLASKGGRHTIGASDLPQSWRWALGALLAAAVGYSAWVGNTLFSISSTVSATSAKVDHISASHDKLTAAVESNAAAIVQHQLTGPHYKNGNPVADRQGFTTMQLEQLQDLIQANTVPLRPIQ